MAKHSPHSKTKKPVNSSESTGLKTIKLLGGTFNLTDSRVSMRGPLSDPPLRIVKS